MRTDSDLEQEIVEAIYLGACEPEGLIQAVRLIERYFGSAGAVLAEFDAAAPHAPLLINSGTIDQSWNKDYGVYAQFDPAPSAYAALPVGKMSTTELMFSSDFLRRNPFLNEFLQPRRVDTALGGTLLVDNGRFAMVSLLGARNRRRFDQEDIDRLERFTPHLRRALQIRRQFLRTQQRSQLLEAIAERNPAGIIAHDQAGTALFVNDAARALSMERDGLTLDRRGCLVLADRAASRRLSELQADVLGGRSGGVIHVQRPSGAPPYLILVSPLPKPQDVLSRAQHGTLFIIHDPSRRVVSKVERIARLLRVPLGAAKVIDALIGGVDLKDYANEEGISANTVKFHLKTAFDRTGTRSQLELLRRTILALDDLEHHFTDSGK
jgi:GAF domain-containing protein